MDNISGALSAVHESLPKVKLRKDEPMKSRTSFKIGGIVRAMYFPESTDEAISLISLLRENEVVPFVMGNGTNLLVSDKPNDIVVINTAGLCSIERTGDAEITAGSGVLLSKLAMFALSCGLSGLEFAHGIPGSLGGAVCMNAGAYGGEMKDVVSSTTVCAKGATPLSVVGEQQDFSYRHSRFSESSEAVLYSVIKLGHGAVEDIREKMDGLFAKRRASQPLDFPSAGSVFKRPKDGFVGAMVEQAGLKGYMSGGAQVSEKHAGFIVNRGGATFSDVMKVIEHVKETIYSRFAIELELEIKVIS